MPDVSRLLALMILMSGCGRIGIDPRPLAPDAPPVACADEGAACDDRNICTTTSACAEGLCTTTEDGGPCEVANFADDFAETQNAAGWFYGYWHRSADPDATYQPIDFRELAIIDALWRPPDWQPEGPMFSWCYIAWWGGHPGSFPDEELPIRRWVSDVTGAATLLVTLKKADPGQGDGVTARVFVDGAPVFARGVAFDDAAGYTEGVDIELAVGTQVDVIMDFNDNDAGDTSELALQIVSR